MLDELVRNLGLQPHPEGGFYRETYRSSVAIGTPRGQRSAGTAIYYLLPKDHFAAFHRVAWDEVWHFYEGEPLLMHFIDQGRHEQVILGRDIAQGERPQVIIRAGVLQAAEPLGLYSLCGCTVAPGFDFADWQMPDQAELSSEFPKHRELFRRLTRK